MNGYRINFLDKRGASCMRFFPASQEKRFEEFVETVHSEATIYDAQTGEKLGEVWRDSGESDDQRRHWNWGYETCAITEHGK